MRRAGSTVDIVSPKAGQIQGMQHHEQGDKVAVDGTIDGIRADEYDS